MNYLAIDCHQQGTQPGQSPEERMSLKDFRLASFLEGVFFFFVFVNNT